MFLAHLERVTVDSQASIDRLARDLLIRRAMKRAKS